MNFLLLAMMLAPAAPARAVDYSVPRDEPAPATQFIQTESSASNQTPEKVMAKWPERARSTGRAMIQKYGPPAAFSDQELIWLNNTPWSKTVVSRDAWPHYVGIRDKDYLKQSVTYHVPDDKINALHDFDRRFSVDQADNELSFRSESESTNFLAMNLADEIVNGKRSVADARDFFDKTTRLLMAGKSSQYTQSLLFENPRIIPAPAAPVDQPAQPLTTPVP